MRRVADAAAVGDAASAVATEACGRAAAFAVAAVVVAAAEKRWLVDGLLYSFSFLPYLVGLGSVDGPVGVVTSADELDGHWR